MCFKSYEHFHYLLTDGRTDIVIIVQTQGLCNILLASQWLGNDVMHMYATFDQNIPCGSGVMNIFLLTANGRVEP